IPSGIPRSCPYHPSQTFSHTYSIECLHMHHRLQIPRTVTDPLFFLLKHSQDVTPRTICWPAICITLH
ncbi:uncharacterized protein BX663DRAFT_441655, partial [Cokeromyces recurvatus]|uniref:uncharacterized protein n=1 Tax=Cokeromyces recurvatus TaxID=90255 RepID=UPI00221EFB76